MSIVEFGLITKLSIINRFCCVLLSKGRGYGSLLIQEMESLLRRGKHRPIQIESASKAVQFFKKQGYTEVGEPMECIHSGSPLFRFLQKMEKFG